MIDIYVLDEDYKRIKVIDIYESLIWTERFIDVGDFEIQMSKKQYERFGLKIDDCLSIDDSFRVMTVRTVVDKDDDEDHVIISGPSFEHILAERVVKESNTQKKPGEIPTVNTGAGITSSTVTFQTNKVTVSVPQGTWVTAKPAVPDGEYLWVRVITNYADTSSSIHYEVIYNDEGPGRPESVTTLYVDSTSQSNTSKAWTTEIPTGTGLGQYMWRKVISKYSNDSRVVYQSVKSGNSSGATNPGGYLHVAFAADAIGATDFDRTSSLGRNYIGTYVDALVTDSTDPDKYIWRSITGDFDPVWLMKNKPKEIIDMLYNHICIAGSLDVKDKLLPRAITPYPASTAPYPDEKIELAITADLLQNPIVEICEAFSIGYRMGINHNSPGIFFEVYSGNRRTATQTDLEPVIFSPHLNNLSDISELTSSEEYRNVAYVSSYLGITKVYPENIVPDIDGVNRRIVLVDASSISPEDDKPLDAIQRIGLSALRESAATHAIDGNISEKIDSAFDTGDIVEMRAANGITNEMRVTERIIVCDKEGKRIYPTLETTEFITPGSWNSWEWNISWADAYGDWHDA